MAEVDVFAFIRKSIPSVWALELLLFLLRRPAQAWCDEDLIRELRSSPTAVDSALAALTGAGFIASEDGRHRYQPASPHLDVMARAIADQYAITPVSVVRAVLLGNDKLRIFSDSFKLKD